MVHVMESPITFAQSTTRFVTIFLRAGAYCCTTSCQALAVRYCFPDAFLSVNPAVHEDVASE
jgi:hypothetical protein